MSASANTPLDAVISLGFGTERAEERIGWRGTPPEPSSPSHFRCEFCLAEHLDCTEISHADTCPVTIARACFSTGQQTRYGSSVQSLREAALFFRSPDEFERLLECLEESAEATLRCRLDDALSTLAKAEGRS